MENVYTIKSAYLKNERPVWLCEPSRLQKVDNLVIFLDGEFYRERIGAVSVIETLLAHGEIAASWFAFVSSESAEARWKECPCYPPFARFVTDEVLPWLEDTHPEMRNVKSRTLAGLSYTGLAAAFTAKECPGVFQKVISQSGSFWSDDGWLVDQFRDARQCVPTDFFLDVGRLETQENVHHREDVVQVVSQIAAVKQFRDALLQSGHSVEYHEFDGGHDFPAWKKSLPNALKWALPRRQ